MFSEFLYSLTQKYKLNSLFSEEHRLYLDFSSKDDDLQPITEFYSSEPEICQGELFYDSGDELLKPFRYTKTEEFLTKWRVTDDAKYNEYEDFWESLFKYKTEIAILSVIAFLLSFSLVVYLWYQRKRTIKYMKIVPDVDI